MKTGVVVRKTISAVVITSLVVATDPILTAQAQMPGAGMPGAGLPGGGQASGWNMAFSILDGAKNMWMQSAQQNMAMMQATSMVAGLQPKSTPAKFFPHCPVPWSLSDKPINACESDNPGEMMLDDTLAILSEKYDKFYIQGMSQAQNTPYPVGLQCVENGRKSVEAQMKDKLNQLEAMITKIKKNTQAFRDQHKQMLQQMSETNAELEGGGALAKQKSKDWKNVFGDPACGEVLSDGLLTDQGTGLRKIQAFMMTAGEGGKSMRDAAVNIQKDAPVIQQHLQTQIQRIKQDIQKVGLEDWIKSPTPAAWNYGNVTQFDGITEAIQLKQRDFEIKMKRINEQFAPMAQYGISMPKMDVNFEANVQRVKTTTKDVVRQMYVNKCVSMAEDGVALTTEQIIQSLSMPGASGPNTRMGDYTNQINIILNNKSRPMDKRLEDIKALDQNFNKKGEIKAIFKQNGKNVSLSVYDLMRDQLNRCEAKFKQDQTHSLKTPGAVSASSEVDKALSYIDEAQALYKTFTSDLAKSIDDKIMNCGGEGNEQSGRCDAKKMNATEKGFCLNTATRCAQNVMSCFNKATTLVKEKEAKLEKMAASYNQNMEALVSSQEMILAQIKASVTKDAAFFKTYFAGSNFELPKDLYVKVPEMELNAEFGVNLRAGGKLDFLDKDLPEQLGKLKEAMAQQGQKMDEEIKKYMDEQKNAMQKNWDMWKEIGQKCKAKAKAIRDKINQQNQAAYQAQTQAAQQVYKDVKEFCHKFRGLASSANPVAGCDGNFSPSQLYEDANKVSSYIDPGALDEIKEYKRLCDQAQANKEGSGSSGSGQSDIPPLTQMCSQGLSDEALMGQMVDRIGGSLPSGVSKDTIRNFVMKGGEGDDLAKITDPEFANSVLGKQITNLRNLKIKAQTGFEPDFKSMFEDKLREEERYAAEEKTAGKGPPAPGTKSYEQRVTNLRTKMSEMGISSSAPSASAGKKDEKKVDGTEIKTLEHDAVKKKEAIKESLTAKEDAIKAGKAAMAKGAKESEEAYKAAQEALVAAKAVKDAKSAEDRKKALKELETKTGEAKKKAEAAESKAGTPPAPKAKAALEAAQAAAKEAAAAETAAKDYDEAQKAVEDKKDQPSTKKVETSVDKSAEAKKEKDPKEDGKQGICKFYKKAILWKSIEACEGNESYSSGCLSKKSTEFKKNLPDELASINSSLAVAGKMSDPVALGWKKLGETRSHSCEANMQGNPMQKFFQGFTAPNPAGFDASMGVKQ